MELKYKEKYAALNTRYQGEITDLHTTIEDMQKIVYELNQKNIELKENIENGALKEEALSMRVGEL
jgi:predicted RNase H-like nuclease (RuvC/YqgF family)